MNFNETLEKFYSLIEEGFIDSATNLYYKMITMFPYESLFIFFEMYCVNCRVILTSDSIVATCIKHKFNDEYSFIRKFPIEECLKCNIEDIHVFNNGIIDYRLICSKGIII